MHLCTGWVAVVHLYKEICCALLCGIRDWQIFNCAMRFSWKFVNIYFCFIGHRVHSKHQFLLYLKHVSKFCVHTELQQYISLSAIRQQITHTERDTQKHTDRQITVWIKTHHYTRQYNIYALTWHYQCPVDRPKV